MKNSFLCSIITFMEPNKCIRAFADQSQISECKKKIKANSLSFSRLSKVLELAGNEVRLKILYLLEEENELCPCDISDILSMSIPAVSQHLRKLKDGNIIESRRDGQTIYYSLKEEHMKVLKPFFKYINQENLKSQTA
jgi:ArsR family transcriptional regulator, lead/cadmium/zinc/bismuth-responsive transcriptional repressor